MTDISCDRALVSRKGCEVVTMYCGRENQFLSEQTCSSGVSHRLILHVVANGLLMVFLLLLRCTLNN
jgi:hypothetical protein